MKSAQAFLQVLFGALSLSLLLQTPSHKDVPCPWLARQEDEGDFLESAGGHIAKGRG